jgi:shikimate dehydrogenase
MNPDRHLMGSTMHYAAVLGAPISHSKSPVLHKFWLEELNIPGDYFAFNVAPRKLEAAILGLQALGFAGANITIPHKETVVKHCHHLSAGAQAMAAVNCLVYREDGTILGDNTDKLGFLAPLAEVSLSQSTVCILGAGGAARAVVAALVEKDVAEIRVVCRNRAKGEALKALGKQNQIYVLDWHEDMQAMHQALYGAALLVNTTPLGMQGQPALPLGSESLAQLLPEAIVYDLIYAPLKTELLASAQMLGFKTINGLEMLIGQACYAFELFYKVRPITTAEASLKLREKLLSC